jgi:L-asparaginase II
MLNTHYAPVFVLTRGEIVESVHYGAIAIATSEGVLHAWWGDPETITYLRSTAKPFQALPFLEEGGARRYPLDPKEIALMCASHSGTDEHVATVLSIQTKTGTQEQQLLCGTHPVTHEPTAEAMRSRGESPTPNRHNCSGKHTGMVAYAQMKGWGADYYIDPTHPVQQRILRTFAEMCGLPMEDVEVGIDGCSAPNFAVSLRHAAQAYARLCDPKGLSPERQEACRLIVQGMSTHPEMVGGPDSFDTHLMQAAQGRLIAKGGAEGYQGVGLLPGAMGPGSQALGIAIKVSDGDLKARARPSITLEILRQMGVLTEEELSKLLRFGPRAVVYNWRKIAVGEAYPVFELRKPEGVSVTAYHSSV